MLAEEFYEKYKNKVSDNNIFKNLNIYLFDKKYKLSLLYNIYKKDKITSMYVVENILDYKKHINRLETEGVIYQKDFHNSTRSDLFYALIKQLKKDRYIYTTKAKNISILCDIDPNFANFEGFNENKTGIYTVIFTYEFFKNNIKNFDLDVLKITFKDMYGKDFESYYNSFIREYKLNILLKSIA
jgi:hypothetical protein